MRHIDKAVALLFAGACATAAAAGPDYAKMAHDMLSSDFRSKGPATVERVTQQDEVQKICSAQPAARSKKVDAKIEASQLKTIVYPADGVWLGKWEEGEKIAQNGRGMQSSDAVGSVNGGNCYACHQLRKDEISFGNIGPSLYQYGKLRGQSAEIMRYTWGKIFNSQAFKACSSMPRFGHNGILTEAQIRDVMALLLDPASPVNQ
ncbi:sulfur oxidation c-type cytochrome SoxX [Duganella sp. FT3S]|uniref:Sulfur oxidation c-type cytochrome SoxX n=1 Tax=Rugamonas fusca TaxID=2758568 RepID=A0A7W2EE91_9BURK|nr:sulfur oxidation c-type cytochrome SoxX [Rugamonas fusca]MBA5604359.1 sulfur oxidation c-type cytochrome SoxX [Rugamonas fusca]